MFANIRKLVVAVIGIALLFVYQRFGVDLTGMEAPIIEGVLMLLTAWGVYQVPNDPPDRA
jgi:hypothetical protein